MAFNKPLVKQKNIMYSFQPQDHGRDRQTDTRTGATLGPLPLKLEVITIQTIILLHSNKIRWGAGRWYAAHFKWYASFALSLGQ